MKLLQQCFLFFIVVVIAGHNLGNSQVSVNRTIGPTLVNLCNCTGCNIGRFQWSIFLYFYTPGIYAEGYIVFVFLFVCSFVCSFVLPSITWNLRQSFA